MALPSSSKSPIAVWKHIGLYGYNVGTFTIDSSSINWKSTQKSMTTDQVVTTTRQIPGKYITTALWTIFSAKAAHLRIQAKKNDSNDGSSSQGTGQKDDKYAIYELRFDGFPIQDFERLKSTLAELFSVDLLKHTLSSSGASFGKTDISGRHLVFRQCIVDEEEEEGEDGDEMLSLDLGEVSQCVLPGNNRNEIELQFHESDTIETGTDQLVQIRFYIPPNAPNESDEEQDEEAATAAELFQQKIMTKASIKNTTGDVIVELDESKGTFLTPRGRYVIELYDSFLRMRGNKYDYKIKYDDISKLFLLPKNDEVHMAFVIALDRPIRQGQQRYQYLVLQTSKERSTLNINLDNGTLESEYNGELQQTMEGNLSNLIAKTFKVITRKKVFIPGKFTNSNQQSCVKCALRANEGFLYPLEKQLIFIHKPPVLILFSDVESVEFQRYAGGQGSTRNFDLCVTLLGDGTDALGTKEYIFSGIDRSDYAPLYSFLSNKKIKILNSDGDNDLGMSASVTAAQVHEAQMEDADDDSEEADEDYGAGSASGSGSGTDSDDSDDDSDLAEVVEESDLDIPVPKKSKKEKEEKKSATITATSEKKLPSVVSNSDRKPEKKRKMSSTSVSTTSSKVKQEEPAPVSSSSKKPKKDPKAPKKPVTVYTLFMKDMNAKVKEKNPTMSFAEVSRQVAAEFKALAPEEKEVYEKRAARDKQRYQEEMKYYKPPDDDDNATTSVPVKKGKKDKNAPKKGLSSYNFFVQARRESIKQQNPSATFGEIAKLCGEEFKKLTPEERKKWEDMAAEDKLRYEREMKNYTPKEEDAPSRKKKKKAVKDPNAPKKNLTSFFLYGAANREEIKRKNPDASFGEIGKIIGQEFNKLSAEEKQIWIDKANQDKERYEREMKAYERKKAAEAAAEKTEDDSDQESVVEEVEESGNEDGNGSGSGSDSDDSNDDSDDDSD